MAQKLILGTAQFGSDYGLKHDGQPSVQEIEKIAQIAWDGGIRVIHTSYEYGLPKICEAIFDQFQWIIKDMDDPRYFRFNDKLGCSIYRIEEVPAHPDLQIVQMPVNVLMPLDNAISLRKTNFELHARSVFLQGLLLIKDISDWISLEVNTMIKTFHSVCKKEELQYYEAALGYVLGLKEIDKIIIGVNSAKQIEELLQVKPLNWDYDFSITDKNVLDPRRWPKA